MQREDAPTLPSYHPYQVRFSQMQREEAHLAGRSTALQVSLALTLALTLSPNPNPNPKP